MLSSTTVYNLGDRANDQITNYFYDDVGRVEKGHQSSLLGSCKFSHTFYDDANRVTATVCGTADLPTTPYTLETLYDNNNPDKYRVTMYEYDTMGRRTRERTNVGSPYEQTRVLFYDSLSRIIKSVANLQPQTTPWSDVGQWYWRLDIERWANATGSAISHGSLNDQNLPEEFQYNELGKVRLKRDTSGQATIYGYTGKGNLRREIKYAKTPDYFTKAPIPSLADRISLANYPLDTTIVDADIETLYTYDGASRITSIDRVRIDATQYETRTEYEVLSMRWAAFRARKGHSTIGPGCQARSYSSGQRFLATMPSISASGRSTVQANRITLLHIPTITLCRTTLPAPRPRRLTPTGI
jgi:YD repeat-containing protein